MRRGPGSSRSSSREARTGPDAFERGTSTSAPAHREVGDHAQIKISISLAVRPLAHLQGHVPGRAADHFYPDLLDERFISSFAIYHQRYSTNTFPTWPLAQRAP